MEVNLGNEDVLIPDCWYVPDKLRTSASNLGSEKGIMRRGSESIKILINHWRWLQVNGTKQQAASCKQQAASLTRKNYNVIGIYNSKQKG